MKQTGRPFVAHESGKSGVTRKSEPNSQVQFAVDPIANQLLFPSSVTKKVVIPMGVLSGRNILSLFVSSLLSLVLLGYPAAAQQNQSANATLIIRIGNVAPRGIVRLGLYTEAEYPKDNAAWIASADVPAVGGETVVTLQNIPAGTYAIEVYQDLNSNGKMDRNFLGLPREPYGFSRDARPRLSKPDFSRVKFDVNPGENTQLLHLQNTTGRVVTD